MYLEVQHILVDLSAVCLFWINHVNHFDGDGEKVLIKNGIEGEVWQDSSIERHEIEIVQ